MIRSGAQSHCVDWKMTFEQLWLSKPHLVPFSIGEAKIQIYALKHLFYIPVGM